MNFSKDAWFKYRVPVVSGIAGIVYTAMLVCALVSCEQPAGNSTGTDGTVPVISITTQPTATTTVTQGSISGSLTVAANVTGGATPAYQWYSNTSNSNQGGSAISGETNAAFTIPSDLTAGTYYYFCEISTNGTASVRSNAAAVTVTVTAGEGTEFVIHLTAITEADIIAQTAYAAANTDKTFTISRTDCTARWYLNSAPVGTSSTYTFNQNAGVYELAVVVTDTAGREYSGSCRVTVR